MLSNSNQDLSFLPFVRSQHNVALHHRQCRSCCHRREHSLLDDHAYRLNALPKGRILRTKNKWDKYGVNSCRNTCHSAARSEEKCKLYRISFTVYGVAQPYLFGVDPHPSIGKGNERSNDVVQGSTKSSSMRGTNTMVARMRRSNES